MATSGPATSFTASTSSSSQVNGIYTDEPNGLASPPTGGCNPNAPIFTPAASENGLPNVGDDAPIDGVPAPSTPEIDPQILEALKSKDRIYVLKLGEQMETLIAERRTRLDLSPSTSYQRLLVHRCSAYYRLLPEPDPINKGISVSIVADSRIPPRRLADLVPPESTATPTFQIMRRSTGRSQAGSVAGDEGDLSDIEPSEAGSIGGRSNATGGSNKKRMTIEQREAAYQEARTRIFMDFEEREKEKEKDMGSSSSLSVISGSASTSGGSVGDIDDSNSSVPTESEWSAPSFGRKGNRSSASSRSVRSSVNSFSNSAGSSRNSRASSPSFNYPSLFDPNASNMAAYDPQQAMIPPPPGGFHPNFYYQYPAAMPPGAPYMAPFPGYYAAYQYPAPAPSDASPGSAEGYPPAPIYAAPYGWPAPAPHPSQHHSAPPSTDGSHVTSPHGQNSPPIPQYQAPYGQPMYGYPPVGMYYAAPPPGAPMMQPPPPQQPTQLYDPRAEEPMPHNANGRGGYVGSGPKGRNSNGRGGGKAAPQPRHAWSYGPGIGSGSEIGPRLTSQRRQSTHSNGGSSGQYRNWDEVSSTVSSSTTSSSSRRTYTSTTSSQHPLPARPDWAVGLKPDGNVLSGNARSGPATPGQRSSAHSFPPSRRPGNIPALHSTDFPPLPAVSPADKRPPIVAGAWVNPPTKALGQFNVTPINSENRLEDSENYERPPPRAAELYNPKVAKHQSAGGNTVNPSDHLAEQVRELSLNGTGAEVESGVMA
ncbi:hypothetical protein CYLTODRAFT_368474 [Cylindrobasidium torrendii FP15055 ss-10]|uniref:SUZ domain-containing protein n=1 Tax=Cylindrobasidium torrendii FP15055 ss-10 TaxID=1314674 RepID=A0A0D7BNU4_9AGAR|nr:hypothetical protein CYLTODRAFT_368474 [Cylindrobasidium torrendii FP15055 ss-10]